MVQIGGKQIIILLTNGVQQRSISQVTVNCFCFPLVVSSFCNVAGSWYLMGNSFIFRSHVIINGHAAVGKCQLYNNQC